MRKLSVGLVADVAEFIRGIGGAKRSVDDLGDEVKQLDHELDKIPPDAAKAAAAMKLLSGDTKDVAKSVNDLGGKGSSLTVLDSKIRSTRSEVRKLADEFAETGKLDVFEKLGDAQGRLDSLTKIRKGVADAIEVGVEDGAEAGLKSPGLSQVLMGVGAAIGPMLVAGIGGAVIGGVGFGVAGLGILGAVLGDPEKFKFAWGQTLGKLKADFEDATKPFTGPTYAALASIGPMVEGWHLNELFRKAVPYEEALVRGAEGFATGIIHGVDALVTKGTPAVNALSQSMDRLGAASGTALSEIADGADGGAIALNDTAKAASYVVIGVGAIVEGFEKLYQIAHDNPVAAGIATMGMSIPLSLFSNADDLTHHLGTTQLGLEQAALAAGHAFNLQGEDLTVLNQQLNAASLSTDTLAASMVNKLFSATMASDQAILGMAESATRLDESFQKNGKTLDMHTAKGQANREAILALVQANEAAYQSNIALGMSAEDAAAAYDDGTAAIERQLHKLGLNQQEIDAVIGKYKGIPKRVDTDIAVNGLTHAINQLDETLRLINGLHDKTVTISYKTYGHPMGQSRLSPERYGGIRRAAEGLIVPPSNPGTVLFGEPETGGEAFIPLQGISKGRAMALTQTVGDSYGFNVVPRSKMASGSLWSATPAPQVLVNVEVSEGAGARSTLGGVFMNMLRNGDVQIRASQIRAG